MRILLFVLAAVVCLILGLTVWPTLYRYDQLHLSNGVSLPIKENRLTGKTLVLRSDGWESMDSEKFSQKDIASLSFNNQDCSISPVEGTDKGTVELSTIDDSRLTLKEITVELWIKHKPNEDGKMPAKGFDWDKLPVVEVVDLKCDDIRPSETGTCRSKPVSLGGTGPIESWSIHSISSAQGIRHY